MFTPSYSFPPGFRWGAATAAYQIEGAHNLDGRTPSVWDTFAKTPGRVRTGENGDIANDHYHRFESDVALMASLGITHYRFSISWTRILPDGTGAVNQRGLDFYKRLLDCLDKYGIEPQVTLFHWDSPQVLEDRYGSWRSRQMAHDFAAYAAVVVKALGDRVKRWTTMNEVGCFTMLGYGVGKPPQHAPGTVVQSHQEVWQAVHHAMLGHGLGVQAIRANCSKAIVSLVDNTEVTVPVTESPADIAAAQKAFTDSWINGGVCMPALTGQHPELFLRHKGADAPKVQTGDLEIISQPLDAWGFNNYFGTYVRAADNTDGYEIVPLPGGYPKMDLPWLSIVPDAAYWGLRHLRDVAGFQGQFFISENGCGAADEFGADGRINDLDRIFYLRAYLRQFHRALAEGIPLEGYFVWSLMDNFEWSFGYAKRFGIIWNDYASQKRTPKESARWYSECIRQNRVV